MGFDRMLKDDDLLARLVNFEDHFVERKTSGDKRDWVKTVVAFANSVPIGYPGVLFIGVRNNGEIENPVNLDELQKTFSKIVDDVWPPPYYESRVLQKGGRQCLAVVVPGSSDRPHFAAASYIRVGSQTKKASEEQFNNLVSQRNSRAYEILKWKGKPCSILRFSRVRDIPKTVQMNGTIIDCNQFYVTYEQAEKRYSTPLGQVEISYDHDSKRLQLVFRELW